MTVKMFKYIFISVLFSVSLVHSTVHNRVNLVDHTTYIREVMQDTVLRVEQLEWCNLKIPDFSHTVGDTILDTTANGTVHFRNGFVISIQNIGVLTSGLNQRWTSTNVTVEGTLNLHDVLVGYDVVAELLDGTKTYTATYNHRTVQFAFSVVKDLMSEEITAAVASTLSTSTRLDVSFLPEDDYTAILNYAFDPSGDETGIKAWGVDVFQPIVQVVVTEDIPFPEICYDCPVS